MLVLFLDQESPVEADVKIISDHVVQISGVEQNLSGFHVLKEPGKLLGKYEDYKTLYRKLAEAYQLSDDGSVYVEPPEPEPEPEATLKEIQEAKVFEMNQIQQSIISNGCEVELSKKRFTLTDNDQLSLNALSLNQLKMAFEEVMGAKNADPVQNLEFLQQTSFPWHPADEAEPCKFYTQEDADKITAEATLFVTYHVTYFRDLRIYIRSLQTKEEVQTITYGTPIPEEYQSEVLKLMLAQNGGYDK